jgi:hypothetical protein
VEQTLTGDGYVGKLLYANASNNFEYDAGTADLIITSTVDWTVAVLQVGLL